MSMPPEMPEMVKPREPDVCMTTATDDVASQLSFYKKRYGALILYDLAYKAENELPWGEYRKAVFEFSTGSAMELVYHLYKPPSGKLHFCIGRIDFIPAYRRLHRLFFRYVRRSVPMVYEVCKELCASVIAHLISRGFL
jgi:hypothetical protein